ncbi:hypothetical protein [Pseudomonas sp. WC2]|jgi:hypothetical protein|uniref:hypothetical protein n=1 Tax=Pseudomonas sp. WC2 TaxID=3424773 RepID=UPI003D34933B
MLLILSPQENTIVRDIIKERIRQAPRLSMQKRLLCAVGASLLVALLVLGVVKPELAIAIAEWVGVLLAF